VLVPTQRVGFAIAHALSESGLSAKFMKGTELDLRYPGIKVITHRSAKGLEFPTVALAGFTQLRPPRTDWDDEWHEWIRIERRALYVAMTRAMRTLLVLAPVSDQTALFEGFAEPLWNTGA
jgi:superfamily I DNA/RNA helicase